MAALQHTSTGISSDQAVPALNNASSRWGVPYRILAAVFQLETSQGSNIRTSSAGAMGAFQFLPSTARQYGYPLTNTPTVAQFNQQADAAAHYLSDLYKRTGSWDAALRAYSGGGYGLAQVQKASSAPAQANEAVASNIIPSPDLSGLDVAGALVSIWDELTTPALWKRVLYFIGGAVLLFWGLKELTGAQIPAMKVAKAAAVAA